MMYQTRTIEPIKERRGKFIVDYKGIRYKFSTLEEAREFLNEQAGTTKERDTTEKGVEYPGF